MSATATDQPRLTRREFDGAALTGFRPTATAAVVIGVALAAAIFAGGNWALPSSLGSAIATGMGAMLLSLGPGVGTAVFVSEYLPTRLRERARLSLRILSAAPTVFFGWLCLLLAPEFLGQGRAAAGLVLSAMMLPMLISLSVELLQAVPQGLREASFGLGGTRLDATAQVVLPAAWRGIAAASLLSAARAIFEMAAITATLSPVRALSTISLAPEGTLARGGAEFSEPLGGTLLVSVVFLLLGAESVQRTRRRVQRQYE